MYFYCLSFLQLNLFAYQPIGRLVPEQNKIAVAKLKINDRTGCSLPKIKSAYLTDIVSTELLALSYQVQERSALKTLI